MTGPHPTEWIMEQWEHIAWGLTHGGDLDDVSERVNLVAARYGSQGLYVLCRAAAELTAYLLGATQALETSRERRPGAYVRPAHDDQAALRASGLAGVDAAAMMDARRFLFGHINGDDDILVGLFKAWDGQAMRLATGVISLARLAYREREAGAADAQ